MKPAPIRRRIAALAGLLALSALVPSANAETVYFDEFNDQQNIEKGGSYTQTLAGSAPTTRSGTLGGSASATWTSNVETGGWGQRDYADNNVATPTSSNYLAFTPQAGYIYRLEADITVNVAIDENWFAIGFVQNPTNWVVNGAYTVADYTVGSQQGIVRWNATNLNQPRHVTYTLDTTAPGWTNTQNIAYVGWFTANPGGVNLNSQNQVSIDNFKLTAGVANPAVTYNGNGSDGGTVPTDGSSPYAHSATVTVLGAGTMTRSGFNFIGWNTAADGNGTDYSPAATFAIYDNTTLYAKWLAGNLVTLTYNGNGSTGGSAPVDPSSPYTSGATATVLDPGSLTKTSHSFDSWNTASDGSGTSYAPDDTFTINANTTLYARWTPGPDYVWNNGAATDDWDTTDANWSGAVWSNSASNNAIFTSVGGSVYLDPGIIAGAVKVGNSGSNFSSLALYDGDLSAAGLTVQGNSSNFGDYGANPTLSVDSTVTITGDAAIGRANLEVSGGTFTADRIISAPASADWGRIVVSGGTVTATNGVDGSVNTGATFALVLNGGELRTPSIKVADREEGTNNNAWLTFNGGTLTATGADNPNFIQLYGGGGNTYVASGGAVIDTNGRNIGILANLLNAGGGLTKQGAGTLTLGGTNTYAGDTTVENGTFAISAAGSLRFYPTSNDTTNAVSGSATATLSFLGTVDLDLSAANATGGNRWSLFNLTSFTGLTPAAVTSTLGSFTEASPGTWELPVTGAKWVFTEANGKLAYIVTATDYDTWKSANGVTGGENDDDDSDGLNNFDEYAFGLDPTGGSEVNPIAVPLDKTGGTFSCTRRLQSLTGLTYTVWVSTDLAIWTEDSGATEGTPVLNGEVETVEITISNSLLTNPRLFIQVRAD